ncbi:MAG: GNAT family N-acetyltransferase [Firmicutes bacterium]|nr:GNAT family N-acetyltransferase [Bacillota bacterium]
MSQSDSSHRDYFLRPLESADCVSFSHDCIRFYQDEADDRWRRYEWPLADATAALQHGATLEVTYLADARTPSAWTLVQQGAERPLGMIVAALHDPIQRTALLGTYIVPQARGKGLQLMAKAHLFGLLAKEMDSYLCFIAQDNVASLQGLRKCSAIAQIDTISCEALSPAWRQEWIRSGQPACLFRITPRQALLEGFALA